MISEKEYRPLFEVNNLGWTCYDCRSHGKYFCKKMPGRSTAKLEAICRVADACEFCPLYIGTCDISGVRKPATHRACGALVHKDYHMVCKNPKWEGQKCRCPACGECDDDEDNPLCTECFGPVREICVQEERPAEAEDEDDDDEY